MPDVFRCYLIGTNGHFIAARELESVLTDTDAVQRACEIFQSGGLTALGFEVLHGGHFLFRWMPEGAPADPTTT
jgi:hypothetical protein